MLTDKTGEYWPLKSEHKCVTCHLITEIRLPPWFATPRFKDTGACQVRACLQFRFRPRKIGDLNHRVQHLGLPNLVLCPTGEQRTRQAG